MSGLIDEGFQSNAAALSGLGAAANQDANQFVQKLRRKQSIQTGIGSLIGTAIGYQTGKRDYSALLGTLNQKVRGGILGNGNSVGVVPDSDESNQDIDHGGDQ